MSKNYQELGKLVDHLTRMVGRGSVTPKQGVVEMKIGVQNSVTVEDVTEYWQFLDAATDVCEEIVGKIVGYIPETAQPDMTKPIIPIEEATSIVTSAILSRVRFLHQEEDCIEGARLMELEIDKGREKKDFVLY